MARVLLVTCVSLALALGLSACSEETSTDPEIVEMGDPVDAPDAPGPFAVGHLSFTAVDGSRGDRPIPIDVWYPVDAADTEGAEPALYALAPLINLESEVAFEGVPVSSGRAHKLIVFSHGYQSINTQSLGLMEALASHGFIVASPEHTGNSQSSATDSFDVAAANRVPDVSFVIDTFFERNAQSEDHFFGRIDEDGVGVVGHSFGGMTSIGMASGWAGAGPDPRVVAIAPVSAVVDGDLQSDERPSPNAGFDEGQLAAIASPVLLIGGTKDLNVPIANNEIAFEQLTGTPAVYKVDVIGATHTHFASICTFGDILLEFGITQDQWEALGAGALIEPYETTCGEDAFPIEEADRLQALFVVAFLRRHLHGETGYDHFLSAGYAETEPAVSFSVRFE